MSTFYVDIPTRDCIGNDEGAWENVADFDRKAEAVEWIRENIGNCDDEGRIGLLTYGDYIYVDIPTQNCIGNEGEWNNVAMFAGTRKAEAIEWIRANIGACDDEGRIGLITG